MSEIINETINELNKPTQNNVFSIEDDPVTVLEKINQVERYLKQIDTSVDTSINTANEALEKANNAFEANGTLVKINGENQLTWSADFVESERQKSKNLFDYTKFQQVGRANYYLEVNVGSSIGVYAPVGNSSGIYCWISQYDENKTYLKGSNYWSDKFILQLEQTTKYLTFDTVSDYAQFMICYANSVDEIGNYQPYNGAIVHEKDIEPVLIYDIDTKNTIGGTAYRNGLYTSGLFIKNDIPNDVTRLRAYYLNQKVSNVDNGGTTNICEIDIRDRNTEWCETCVINAHKSDTDAVDDTLFKLLLALDTDGIMNVKFFKNTTKIDDGSSYIYRLEGLK